MRIRDQTGLKNKIHFNKQAARLFLPRADSRVRCRRLSIGWTRTPTYVSVRYISATDTLQATGGSANLAKGKKI